MKNSECYSLRQLDSVQEGCNSCPPRPQLDSLRFVLLRNATLLSTPSHLPPTTSHIHNGELMMLTSIVLPRCRADCRHSPTALQSSGVGLDDQCVEKFQELKLGKSACHHFHCRLATRCCCCSHSCCCIRRHPPSLHAPRGHDDSERNSSVDRAAQQQEQ